MSAYLWLLIFSTIGFMVWAGLCSLEDRRQQRILLPRLRTELDRVVEKSVHWVGARLHYVSRYFLTLGWYYSMHALLKACLRFIANMYFVLEYMFEKNRARTKQLRREQRQKSPYFSELTAHKSSVALSKSKQNTLKKQALEGK